MHVRCSAISANFRDQLKTRWISVIILHHRIITVWPFPTFALSTGQRKNRPIPTTQIGRFYFLYFFTHSCQYMRRYVSKRAYRDTRRYYKTIKPLRKPLRSLLFVIIIAAIIICRRDDHNKTPRSVIGWVTRGGVPAVTARLWRVYANSYCANQLSLQPVFFSFFYENITK